MINKRYFRVIKMNPLAAIRPFRCVVKKKKVKEKRKRESTIINDNEDSVERVAKEMPLCTN